MIAEGADSVGEFVGSACRVLGAAVVGSKVLIIGAILQHMIDDAQQVGRHGDSRLLRSGIAL